MTGLVRGEIHVWRIRLDEFRSVPPPTAEEADRASRFAQPILGQRYLRAHGALRAILGRYTSAPLEFAEAEHKKPYLRHAPECQFNLTHSHDRALVAVALEVEIGVDVEHVRDLPDRAQIAERFFPPSEAVAHEAMPEAQRGRDFFRRWTRIEAILKARGVGLYGMGEEAGGEWTVHEIPMEADYEAAVAAPKLGMTVSVYDF